MTVMVEATSCRAGLSVSFITVSEPSVSQLLTPYASGRQPMQGAEG